MRRSVWAFLGDALLVVLFAALGRASHYDGDPFGPGGLGLLQTSWPFIAALVFGWAVLRAWQDPIAPLHTGIPLWLITLGGGMLLRAASGTGMALPFILVAAGTILLLLVGWRLLAAAVRRRPAAAAEG